MKKSKLLISLFAILIAGAMAVSLFTIYAATANASNVIYTAPTIYPEENDVPLPLPEYPAEAGFKWNMPPVQSRFQNEDGSCRTYASSRECDGFARYVHDQFWHMNYDNWGSTWDKSSGDYRGGVEWDNTGSNAAAEKAEMIAFFQGLPKGTFIRYVKYNDPTPENGTHSLIFLGCDPIVNGVWVYECNQDAFVDNDPDTHCGVGLQVYPYDTIFDNYDILYYVEHTLEGAVLENATYHTVGCTNCDGYLRQTHTTALQKTGYDLQQHSLSYGCCSGYYALENHTDSTPTVQQYNAVKHQKVYDCCGAVYENHQFVQQGSTPGATMVCRICNFSMLLNNVELEPEIA